MTMEQQEEKKTDGKKVVGYACCIIGCGVSLCACVCAVVYLLYVFDRAMYEFHEFGENEATFFLVNAEKGTNFSYQCHHGGYNCEFTISEADFLDWCKNREKPFEVIEIKDLPSPITRYNREKREVDNGYYYERRLSSGVVTYILYDRENKRCYIEVEAKFDARETAL